MFIVANTVNEKNDNPYNEINFSADNVIKAKMPPIGRNFVFDAFQISVLFFPVHILFNAWFYKDDNYNIELVALLICSVMTFFIMLSDSVKHAGYKWLLSLPFSLIWIMYIRASQFNIRILNWLIPEFGEPNFGTLGLSAITLMIYAFMTLFALGIGLAMCDFVSDIRSETVYRFILTVKKICSIVCVVIAAAILLLSIGMPAYVKTAYG